MALLEFGLLVVIAHLSYGQNSFGNAGFSNFGNGFGVGQGINIGTGSFWGSSTTDSTTITCAVTSTNLLAALTLRRSNPAWGGWGWGRSGGQITGTFSVLTPAATTGTFSLVFTRRARDNECTTDSLGTVIGRNVWGRQRFGNPWAWGSSSAMAASGEVISITLSGNDDKTIDIPADRLPLRQLSQYAGRGVGICTSLTTRSDGRQECTTPIACCKLAYDNQDAVRPTPT